MDMKKVSMIVPVFNGEQYVERSIAMLKAQDYPDLEIVIVNDGSTDNTYEMISSAVSDDTRFRLYSQSNGGPAAARNLGLKMAMGEYICFVDFDDYIFPNYVSYLYSLLVNTDSDIACADCIRLAFDDPIPSIDENAIESNVNSNDAIVNMFYRRQIRSYAVCKLLKADLARKIRFVNTSLGEDLIYNFNAFKLASSISYSNKVLYIYFQNPSSIVASGKGKDISRKWSVFTQAVLSDPICKNSKIRSAIRCHAFVMASDLLTQMESNNTQIRIYQTLYKFIKKYGIMVFKDHNSKTLNRAMGLIASICPVGYLYLCRAYKSFLRQSGKVKKASV